MTSRQLAALLLIAAVWGGSFLFIRVLVDAGMDPLGVSAGRCLLGMLVLAPIAWAGRRQFPRSPRTIAALAILGTVNMSMPWTLFAIGEQHVPSGVASIGNSSTPLWTAILATLLVRGDALTRVQQAGLIVGFSGIVALTGDDLASVHSDAFLGTLAVLAATMCYGVSAVSIRRWLRDVPAVPLTIGQLVFASLLLAPLALLTGAYDGAEMGLRQWGSILALGAAGSGLAVTIYMWLIGQVGPVRASVVTYLFPPIGVALGWLFLDETIGWNLLAGLVLVVAGVALVQGWALHRLPLRLAGIRRSQPASIPD